MYKYNKAPYTVRILPLSKKQIPSAIKLSSLWNI